MTTYPLIPTAAAIKRYGRPVDGFGGKAALARHLQITIAAIDRFSTENLPEHHAARLLEVDPSAEVLVINRSSLSKKNARPKKNRPQGKRR